MPKIRPLCQGEARGTLAHRFAPLADRLRQFATDFGIRSRRVFLTWVASSGEERGEGRESLLAQHEILPTPRVGDLTAVTQNPFSAGVLPVGTLRVDRISALLTADELFGRRVPHHAVDVSARNVDFFWEVVEDGRGDNPPARARYRVYGSPWRDEGGVHWVVLLERAGEDLSRRGRPQPDVDPGR